MQPEGTTEILSLKTTSQVTRAIFQLQLNDDVAIALPLRSLNLADVRNMLAVCPGWCSCRSGITRA